MIVEFAHPKLGEEVQALAGYYIPYEEHTLPYRGREVIYILGHVCVDGSCCGTANCDYVQVPGFLKRKHIRTGETTSPVSEVEIIQDEADRKNIRDSLTKKYPDVHIEIW